MQVPGTIVEGNIRTICRPIPRSRIPYHMYPLSDTLAGSTYLVGNGEEGRAVGMYDDPRIGLDSRTRFLIRSFQHVPVCIVCQVSRFIPAGVSRRLYSSSSIIPALMPAQAGFLI